MQGVQGEHLSTDAAAPVHAFSPGKAEGPEMPQPQSKADAHDPAAPFTSLQYSLSEEQMALIHENAQQYMQEHEDSPWQLPVLQPAVTSPEVVHTGQEGFLHVALELFHL